jgi:GTP-binding protein
VNVELAHDADGPKQFPRDGLAEVAILGRSNVGKSTFLNALVGRRRLARTSRRPGKTRRIHFYRLDSSAYLVDFPGFGYAAVGRKERRSWRQLVESYLRGTRAELRGALLLVDPRRGLQPDELDLLEWLAAEKIESRVILTKIDKLKRGEIARALEVRKDGQRPRSGRCLDARLDGARDPPPRRQPATRLAEEVAFGVAEEVGETSVALDGNAFDPDGG